MEHSLQRAAPQRPPCIRSGHDTSLFHDDASLLIIIRGATAGEDTRSETVLRETSRARAGSWCLFWCRVVQLRQEGRRRLHLGHTAASSSVDLCCTFVPRLWRAWSCKRRRWLRPTGSYVCRCEHHVGAVREAVRPSGGAHNVCTIRDAFGLDGAARTVHQQAPPASAPNVRTTSLPNWNFRFVTAMTPPKWEHRTSRVRKTQ